MAGMMGQLRKKMPKQRSEMTDEEQMNTPEEGAQEQGFLETVEDAMTQGRDQLGDVKGGSLSVPGAVGGMGFIRGASKEETAADAAKKAVDTGKKLFNELGQRMPPKVGEKIVGKGLVWKD